MQGTLGPEFAQIHLVRPHKYSICMQGHLTRLEEIGLLTKASRHWYAVANGILYEYSPRKVCNTPVVLRSIQLPQKRACAQQQRLRRGKFHLFGV